ncbi:PREDICTED: uncharacterized protein LOC105364575 [Ceratosolen solmsi marchali]|uniref:Uncharacterized protein LOC105364575 n=1 Tax=Ceratosolen solmsi marchali TaxID=326594 RepID=A0AAJ7DYA6_9HYME|nr:PREDICTED: uncharacterized protein LOC105364575 [Ceratosolen solmsi marchali]
MALQYVHLASDVQKSNRASSVFIVNVGEHLNGPESTLMTKMTKEFSRKYILSRNLNIIKIHEEIEYYKGKAVQPLFVVMFRTLNDVHQFAAMTKTYNMALHEWLLIFMDSPDAGLNEFCHNPHKNLFNLGVSTKMLVKCYNDPILREWYSINKKTIDIFDYATWSFGKGMRKLSNLTFFKRRNNLKGITLKVAAVKDSTTQLGRGSTMGGYFGVVITELSKIMNFTIDFTSVEDSYGSWNETKHEWTGVIRRLVSREIDIGIGEFTMNQQRAAVIDYSVALMRSTSNIYIKRPRMSNIGWSTYVKAFHLDIWIIILTTLLFIPILLAMMWKVVRNYDITYYIVEEYLRVWGIYCQKPLPDLPSALSLRIAYISIFMSSMVLFAVYSAYLTSYQTVFKPSIPFNTFEGFVADGTYKLIIFRYSSNYDLFKVCYEKVVLYTNQLILEKATAYAPCELMPLTAGRLDSIALAVAKQSPYTEFINYQ